jgi:hypothetical protein
MMTILLTEGVDLAAADPVAAAAEGAAPPVTGHGPSACLGDFREHHPPGSDACRLTHSGDVTSDVELPALLLLPHRRAPSAEPAMNRAPMSTSHSSTG